MKYVTISANIIKNFGIKYLAESLAIHDPVNKLIDKNVAKISIKISHLKKLRIIRQYLDTN